jgi:PAS domain S-box-containing protein
MARHRPFPDTELDIGTQTGIEAEALLRLKKLEVSLKERERELQQARRIARLGTWRFVVATEMAEWSEEVYEVFGLDPRLPSPPHAVWQSWHTPESAARRDAAVAKALRDGELYEHEMELVLPDGAHRWIVMRGEAGARDSDGRVTELRGTLQDITARKQTELALRDRESELREAHRISGLGTWRFDPAKGEALWSPEIYAIFGLDPRIGPPSGELLGPMFVGDGWTRSITAIEHSIRTGDSYEFDAEIVAADGVHRWFTTRGAPARWGANGEVLELRGTVQDVTARKQIELALRDREQELTEAHRINRIGTWRMDVPSGKVTWSQNVYRLFGADPSGPVPGPEQLKKIFTPESYEMITMALYRARDTGVPYELDAEITSLDGANRWICARGMVARRGVNGEILELRGTVQDVTERKAIEEALRERERRFRELAESLPEMVWVSEPDGQVSYINQSFELYLGVRLEEMTEGHAFGHVHPEDRSRSEMLWQRSLTTGEPYEMEIRLRRHDGVYRTFLARAVTVRNERGEIERRLGTATDIDDQKLAEEAVRRTEKLAATGRLAASIAHEINNPLAAVMNLFYLTQLDETLGPQTRAYLTQAEQELARVAAVTTQTLRFHQQSSAAAEADLGEVMDSAYALFENRFRSRGIPVRREYECRERLFCRGDELRQVFANLLSNALDAMQDGGSLRIRIRLTTGSAGERGVRVTVGDSGQGIPRDLMRRIFEPFVSTKAATGTGLGLWVSQGIVQRHKGKIRVRSRAQGGPGTTTGTVFSMFLPLSGMRETVINGSV